MSNPTFISGGRIFDGSSFVDEFGLLINGNKVVDLTHLSKVPKGSHVINIARDSLIVPGFVDLQVNGGGGVMFNDVQSVEAIKTICAAHALFGTTTLLPTLITDTPQITNRALSAGIMAAKENVPGFLGLHMEGPHLSVGRKGAHDAILIRPMNLEDLDALVHSKEFLPVLLTTIAPENVTEEQVAALSKAGIKVSLGHTNATFETASKYAKAGASLVTHLFNAMSPLGHREPGMVGAALENGQFHAGLIADGFHVEPATIAIALRAKLGHGHIFLVTDAMSTIGTDLTEFSLNGRRILRQGGKLTLEDGTLAGADIDMISSVRYLHQTVGLDLAESLRMASLYPAKAIGMANSLGRLEQGYDASFAVLDSHMNVTQTWIKGTPVFSAQ